MGEAVCPLPRTDSVNNCSEYIMNSNFVENYRGVFTRQ